MIKLYRGDVIRVYYTDGKGGLKERHVIVYKDIKPEDTIISVYCTSQNDGNDHQNILVLMTSEEGIKMGLTADTYIRPLEIKFLPYKAFIRKVGNCGLMGQIQKIIDQVS